MREILEFTRENWLLLSGALSFLLALISPFIVFWKRDRKNKLYKILQGESSNDHRILKRKNFAKSQFLNEKGELLKLGHIEKSIWKNNPNKRALFIQSEFNFGKTHLILYLVYKTMIKVGLRDIKNKGEEVFFKKLCEIGTVEELIKDITVKSDKLQYIFLDGFNEFQPLLKHDDPDSALKEILQKISSIGGSFRKIVITSYSGVFLDIDIHLENIEFVYANINSYQQFIKDMPTLLNMPILLKQNNTNSLSVEFRCEIIPNLTCSQIVQLYRNINLLLQNGRIIFENGKSILTEDIINKISETSDDYGSDNSLFSVTSIARIFDNLNLLYNTHLNLGFENKNIHIRLLLKLAGFCHVPLGFPKNADGELIVNNETRGEMSKMIQFQKHIRTKAIDFYSKAIDVDSEHMHSYLKRSFLYGAIGEYKNAIKDCKKLIKHFPNHPNYYQMIGEYYCKDEQYVEAIESCNKAIELDVENKLGLDIFRCYQYRGISYFNIGKLEKAGQDKLKAIEIFEECKNHFPY